MSTVKDAISQAVDRLADELETLSKKIHDNPELAYQEVKACAWLAEFLGKQGFKANMTSLGLTEGEPIPDRKGSSDVGNVSQVLPTIQPMIGIAPEGMAIHTRDFADAAVKPLARQGMIAAAKTMAMTTFDLLAEPARVKAAKKEFTHGS